MILTYKQGFRKMDPDRWEFGNEGFLRSHKQLLKNIRRRRPTEPQQFGADTEVAGLRRDKRALITELVKLRQEQQNTRAYLRSMEHKLQGTEMEQKQMMSFLARAMQNSAFVEQLLQDKEKRKALEETINRERTGALDQGSSSKYGEPSGSVAPVGFGFQSSSMEALGLEESLVGEGADKVLDEMFWEELLTARLEEGMETEDRDDLGSNPK